jgi:hypothetical protein
MSVLSADHFLASRKTSISPQSFVSFRQFSASFGSSMVIRGGSKIVGF